MNKKKSNNIKDTGFITPKNYFDDLENSIIDQIKLQEKVKGIGFKIPDDYLETLEDKILNKVAKRPKVVSLFTKRNLFYASSIAASLVLMFSIFVKKNNLTFDNLETVSIENYLSEEDLSDYEIALLLTDDELSTDNFLDVQLSKELIENYLLENATIEDLIFE